MFAGRRSAAGLIAVVLGGGLLAAFGAPAADAAPTNRAAVAAAPAGTILVSPSQRACLTSTPTPRANVECGTALVQRWLRTHRLSDVVRQTVLVPANSAGAWPSSTTGGACGFSGLSVRPTGMHHCDRTTFVDLVVDADLIATRLTAFTALAHESAHGVQESRGKDPVAAYLRQDRAAMLPMEQQADCWAGVAVAWAMDEGVFDRAQWPQARAFLRSIGRDGSGHGSGAARERQLVAGYTGGPKACGLA